MPGPARRTPAKRANRDRSQVRPKKKAAFGPVSDTRQRLVDAARELFWSQGYEATGLKDILAKAGANSGSLYYFFKTKEDLLLAVLDWYVDNLHSEVMSPAFALTDDPIERVFSVLDGYARLLRATHCTGGCPIGNLALELANPSDAVREKITRNLANWCRAIESCFDDAADRLVDGTDTAALAQMALTVMEGGILQARAYRSVAPYQQAVAQFRLFVHRLTKNGDDAVVRRKSGRSKRSGKR
jgi:AcrR family transcriptional regulator